MADPSRAYLPRLARQLLIRQEATWTGNEARTVVKIALMAVNANVDTAEFRSLVAATYRVGRNLEPVIGVARKVPWKIEGVREALRACPDMAGAPDKFIEHLGGMVKGFDLTVPQRIDWAQRLTQCMATLELEDFFPDLRAKARAAAHIVEMLEGRLTALVRYVEAEQDVSEADVLAALGAAIEQHQHDAADGAVHGTSGVLERERERGETAAARLSEEEVAQLARVVHPEACAAFCAWVNDLAPVAQRNLQRRLGQLRIEPLVHRLWVKPILGLHGKSIHELKVIAAGVHYRVLFQGEPGATPLVLSFGLRRDLEDLVTRADALSDAEE